MTKYIVSGYLGFDNFGDEAIASVLVSYLKSHNAEKITLISANPVKTSKLYDVDAVGMLKFFSAIKEADVLISGGGSLLQDITSLKSLVYYLLVIFWAHICRKKVIIFAQGFTPFRTKIGYFLTKYILKKCHSISVRDIKSQELLLKMEITSELVSDPVYSIYVNPDKHVGIGVQLRSFATMNDEILISIADEIQKCFKEEEIKLISLQDSFDLPVLENFSKKLEERSVRYKIYKNLSINEAIELLSGLEYLVGMRFHANLVAAKAGVKILGINYDAKVAKLADCIGFPLIELTDKKIEEKFKQFKNLDVDSYKIPEYKFSNIA